MFKSQLKILRMRIIENGSHSLTNNSANIQCGDTRSHFIVPQLNPEHLSWNNADRIHKSYLRLEQAREPRIMCPML